MHVQMDWTHAGISAVGWTLFILFMLSFSMGSTVRNKGNIIIPQCKILSKFNLNTESNGIECSKGIARSDKPTEIISNSAALLSFLPLLTLFWFHGTLIVCALWSTSFPAAPGNCFQQTCTEKSTGSGRAPQFMWVKIRVGEHKIYL